MGSRLQWVCVDGVTMLRKGNELFADLDEYLLAVDREVQELDRPIRVDITKRIMANEKPNIDDDIAAMDDLLKRIIKGSEVYGFKV